MAKRDDELAQRLTDAPSASVVIEALAGYGYTFVEPGTPGRFFDTAEETQGLALHLTRKTGLHVRLVHVTLTAIERAGVRIREPDAHPSGLRTTLRAFETIPRTTAQAVTTRMYRG